MSTQNPSVSRPAHRQDFTHLFVPACILLTFTGLVFVSVLGGCTPGEVATAKRTEAAVVADVDSPAGQRILADVSSEALNVGLDLATGNDTGAVIAGIQGAASAARDYEGLPVAPASTTVAKAAANGAGVASVASALTPAVAQIIDRAQTSAHAQNVVVSTDAITEALARGLDAVASAKYQPPVTRAGTKGEAP